MAASIVSDLINSFHFENGKIKFRPPGSRQNSNMNNIMGMLSQFKGPAMALIRNISSDLAKDLKIGQMVENVEKMDEKTLNELKNHQYNRQQQTNLIKSDWRESVTSLKPQDTFYKLGERKSGLTSNYAGPPQDFVKLKEKCLLQGQLFDDPAFPASDQSFYLHGRGPKKFKWLRPHQIVNNPKFISHGAGRFDVNQGELGNCWFLAAVANLTMNEKYFDRVVPNDQSFDKSDYAGIFHFRFWQYGKWIDVCVDDKLPTINGKLVMMHSEEVNEFWGALLEKAYAKLHGSYESLKGGTTSEAMEDFTGGLTEHYEIQTEECPPNLYTIMHKAYQRGSFMGCSISVEDASQMEAVMPNGLIKGHAYSITSVKYIQLDHARVQGKIPLVRIRNPWGNEAEWTGAWSDKSREWGLVSDDEKQRIGLTFDADGEFWMSFADFQKNFTNIEITNLTPDSLDDDSKKTWQVNYFEGQWIPGVSAGGCRNHLETFHLNPQYMITLVDQDEDDELCTCVVALMQKNHRIKRKMGLDNLTIGFVIYEVRDNAYGVIRQSNNQVLLTTNFFKYNASCARSPAFINLREVNGRYRLKPGRYCIIPSTFEPNQKGDFIIRFFTEKPAKHVMENDEEIGMATDIPVSPASPETNDIDDNNDVPVYDGPPIDETIIGDYKPDPDPIPEDRGTNNFNIMQIINMCLPLVSMASDCYHGRNVSNFNPQDFFNTALHTFGMGEKRPKRAADLSGGVQDIGDPYEERPEEKSAYKFFSKIAGDDLEVDSLELQKVINHVFKKELKFEGFSIEACRSMIALMDTDASGKLGFDEFVILWRHLRNWAEVFKNYDREGNMAINSGQLKEAFRAVGINVNRGILRLLVNRYGHRPKDPSKIEDEIYFNDFISCALKMKRCIEIWNSKKIRSTPTGGLGDIGRFIPGAIGALSGGNRGFGNAFSAFAGSFGPGGSFNRSPDRPKTGSESAFTLDELGERKSGLTSNYAGRPQDFAKLKEECLLQGQLFDDPAFPASDQSFYLNGSGPEKFQWLRPRQIVDDPKFISHGAERFDVNQGELGNCWFLAAVANLTMNKKYFGRVVPNDQSFDELDYAGIFHFRFWQYGKWIDVCVDDKLPTINGRLVMMHSKEANEFWGALLEKAYAKLYGSYESLKGGTTNEAMEDFTGGLTEYYEIQTEECPPNLYTIMHKGYQRGSFMGCSISVQDASQMEAVMPNGLIKGHAYSITSVKYIQLDHARVQGKIPLVRIRNPWGNEAEWTGAWSDKSIEWDVVSDEERKRIGLTADADADADADGEFWMSFADFQKNFTNIEITNLTPDSLDDDSEKTWQVNYFEGQWIPGVSAGGCRNHLETFYLNPQYMITLGDQDEDDQDDQDEDDQDDQDEDDELCVVALMQKNRRIKHKMGLDNLAIGFSIYEVSDKAYGIIRQSDNQVLLTTNFFNYNASCARSPTFINLREVSGRYCLKPGRYCIIPSTYEPNQKGDFIIRFFTEKPAKHVMENDEEIGIATDVPVSPDTNNINDVPVCAGQPINETIIRAYKPDPDPIPEDRGLTNNFNIMQIINMCSPFASMTGDYGRNVSNLDPQDFSNTELHTFGMGENRPKRAADLNDGVQDIGDPYEERPGEKSAYKFFSKIAGDDLEVDSLELQKVINHVFKKELKFGGFSLETCRSMIALMDTDASGKLGFDEFVILWRHLRNWAEVFKNYDREGNMAINSGQLKEAFRAVGINVNRVILRLLVKCYGHRPKDSRKIEDEIYFNDFISCALKMKRCIEIWNSQKIRSTSTGGLGDIGRFMPGAIEALGGGNGEFGNAFGRSFKPSGLVEFVGEVLYS